MNKIIACIVGVLLLTGCDNLTPVECDVVIRDKYTNCIVTKLTIVEHSTDEREIYHPKWLVKTPDNKIILNPSLE